MSVERFLIRGAGEEWGKLTIQQAYRMLTRGEIAPPIEYYSEALKQWRPIAGIMFELEPSRLDDMRQSGITRVSVLGVGNGEDCLHCTELFLKAYPIDEAPQLPPEKCNCIPWCRCLFIPVA
jgi:hypothetical protein